MKSDTRRKILHGLVGFGLIHPLVACGRGNLFMKNEVVVNVLVFNYLNRPIFDVFLNREMVGGSASLSNSPYGQFSTVTGVSVPLGRQTLTWRVDGPEGMQGNGDIITVKNILIITPEQIPPNVRALGVHIYPDYTAELIFSANVVEQSERGLIYAKKFQKNG